MTRFKRKLLHAATGMVGLAGMIFLALRLDLEGVGVAMSRIGVGFIPVVLAHLLVLVLDAKAVRATVRGNAPSLGCCLRIGMTGHALNVVTPGGQAGEVVKLAHLAEEIGGAAALPVLLCTNVMMLGAGLLLLGVGAAAAVLGVALDPRIAALLIVMGGGCAAGVAGVVLLLRHGAGAVASQLPRSLRPKVTTLAAAVDGKMGLPLRGRQLQALFFAALSPMAGLLETWIILVMLGAPAPLLLAVMARAGSQLVAQVTSMVPLQAGTAEAGAYALFTALGVPPSTGVAMELVRKLRALVFVALGLALMALRPARVLDEKVAP